MTQYQSDKLRLISFVCILLVLYIHSDFHFMDTEVESMSLCYYLQEGISEMLGRLAVPMFFAISGALFFKGTDESIKDVYQKQRRRVKTLVVPYIFATLFISIFFLIHLLTGALHFLEPELHYLAEPWWMILFRLFLYNIPGEGPYSYYLWFLRDLIIVVCFTPLLWKLKRLRFGFEIFMILMFLISLFSIRFLPIKAFFWFCFGAKMLQKPIRSLYVSFGLLFYIAVSIFQLVLPNDVWKYFEYPIIVIGVLCLWHYYDKVVPATFLLESHKMLNLICHSIFFIYLYHATLLNIIRWCLVNYLPHSLLTYALAYLVSPWITIACLVVIALLLQKLFPRFYSVLVGGRVFNRSYISPNNP